MTEKISVEDIIGIVKTDEPTDSVEEVRKLRGRETECERLKNENESLKKEIENNIGAFKENSRKRLELEEENKALKQYKQAVRDILTDWSQKNLPANTLGIVIAIMEELNVGDDGND